MLAPPPRAVLLSAFKKSLGAVSHAWLACSLLAAGCIENPGIDPEVGRAKPETAVLEATFRDARILQLRATRDSGRLSLRAVNPGLGKLDSATFFLQASSFQFNPLVGMGFYPEPAFEYYGRLPALGPGETFDVGVIDSLLPGNLHDYHLHAILTHVSEDGRRGSRFGGVYTGTHRGLDTSGREFQGAWRGIVSADGAFRFHVSSSG